MKLRRLEENLRLCLVQEVPGAITFLGPHKGTYSGPPLYGGPLAETLNSYIEPVFGPYKMNFTVVLKESFGGKLNHGTATKHPVSTRCR